jgi:predicted RNase H-like HicB family nuclease
MRYPVVLEGEAGGGCVVSVPALPGCVSEGDTRAEALANVREASGLYLDHCREAGDSISTEAGVRRGGGDIACLRCPDGG